MAALLPHRRFTVEELPIHAPCACMKENWTVLGSRATKQAAINLAVRLYKGDRSSLAKKQVIDNKNNHVVWSMF